MLMGSPCCGAVRLQCGPDGAVCPPDGRRIRPYTLFRSRGRRGNNPNDQDKSGSRKTARRSVSRVLSTGPYPPAGAECGRYPGDGHSSGTPVAGRLTQPTRTAARKRACTKALQPGHGRPYSVLLPVGFTMPPPSPGARCALTAPFHPCPCRPMVTHGGAGRFAFCGTFPGVAPAGRYPAPCFRGARTFLSPTGFPIAGERPSDRLARG
ncbi:MAG: hypothetical protein RLY86_4167 [Pseudomonadota bacterium]